MGINKGAMSPMRFSTLIAGFATTLFVISCGGGGGGGGGGTATAPPVPTATLTANPTSVASGGTTTLTWSSTDATSCTASGGWAGTLGTSGTQVSGPVTANTSFSLTCTGAGGTSSATAAPVSVSGAAPTVSLTVYPTVVATGESSVITWNTMGATACTASSNPATGNWTGSQSVDAGNHTQNTGALGADSTFTLNCTGTGSTPTAVTASVAISATAMSVTPATAALTLSRTQQYTVTVPGGGPATWTVDNVSGGNPTVGTISEDGLFTSGTAPGVHTVAATSVANNTHSVSVIAAVTDLAGVYTYHNNQFRDGTNTQEYALTTSTVSATHFGKLTSCPVDGAIYGQPLWVANLMVGGAKHNVIFVATQHDSLYAFDADAVPCTKLWSQSLIDAPHGGASGETSVPSTLLGARTGDVLPEVGITGTPVIDPTRNLMFVVAKSTNTAQTSFYQRLHAIDLATGNEMTGSPVLIAGTYPGSGDGGTTVTFNSRMERQRTGLALANGVVYIAWGSYQDTLPWYGWMMGYQYANSAWTQTSVINVSPNLQASGIWMSGGAPAVDSNNKLYVITGNGGFNITSPTAPNNDYGDTLLQMNPNLTVAQWFTPSDEMDLDLNDRDFGAGGATVLADLPAGSPVTHVLMTGGKDGQMYLLNRDLLGGFGDPVAVQKMDFGSGIFGTGAFWNNSFYLSGFSTPLQSWKLTTATVQLAKTGVTSHSYPYPGTTPSISASSATQNGVVWSLDTNAYCQGSAFCGPAIVFAHDANNLATELWDSSVATADTAGNAVKYMVPTVANGRVYVGTRGNNIGTTCGTPCVAGELDVYGIKQ
jgi:hypothetical protein